MSHHKEENQTRVTTHCWAAQIFNKAENCTCKIATVNIFTLSYKSLLKAEADLNVYLPLEQILNCKWVHFTMKTVIFYIPFWYNNCWCAVVVIHFYLQWKKRGDFLIDFVIFFKNQSMTWTPSYLFYEYLKIQAFNLEPFYKE